MSNTRLSGVGVSSGRASGPAVRVADPLPEPATGPEPADRAAEAARIAPAAEAVAARLERSAADAEGDRRAILETTAAMAADPALVGEAEQLVTARGLPAPRAVHEAAGTFADALASAGGYLAERVGDIRDVARRIIAELTGVAPPGMPVLTAPSILVARDLAPADTAGLDPALVLGLVTEEGGPTSHTAILARSLRIPAVVACHGILDHTAAGLVVDGDTGDVELLTGDVVTQAAVATGPGDWNGVGTTADGHRVKVLANVGGAADARAGAAAGAEGVGLFRTEFSYLSATTEPTEEQQRAAYAEVLKPFAGKPVVVRTLDAGADKPLRFLAPEPEPNPALGVRGVRVARQRAGLIDRQLAAIAGAAADSGVEVSVMAPMVATAEEADWFVSRARAAGLSRAGVMIEVPAAALTAREIFEVADFVSLGTNDLAQYLFAADRQVGAVAALNDPWQPALLRLVAIVGEAAARAGKPAGVCGEAAADPLLACVLVGLGVSSLSMNPSALDSVGALLAVVSLDQCQTAGRITAATGSPAAARTAARAALGPLSG